MQMLFHKFGAPSRRQKLGWDVSIAFFDLGIEGGVPANVGLRWGVVASFMNSWGQLFDIVKQLSPTAWNCQAGFHPDNRNLNGTIPLRFLIWESSVECRRTWDWDGGLRWWIVASFMNSWDNCSTLVWSPANAGRNVRMSFAVFLPHPESSTSKRCLHPRALVSLSYAGKHLGLTSHCVRRVHLCCSSYPKT